MSLKLDCKQATLNGGTGYPAGRTPLMMAAINRSFNVVKLLKKWSADVNILDSDQWCAMTYALESKDEAMIEEVMPDVIPSGVGLQEIYKKIARYEVKMTQSMKVFIQKSLKGRRFLETLLVLNRILVLIGGKETEISCQRNFCMSYFHL